jgi:hypothetical protein
LAKDGMFWVIRTIVAVGVVAGFYSKHVIDYLNMNWAVLLVPEYLHCWEFLVHAGDLKLATNAHEANPLFGIQQQPSI